MNNEATPQTQYYLDRITAELSGRSEDELKAVLHSLGTTGIGRAVQPVTESVDTMNSSLKLEEIDSLAFSTQEQETTRNTFSYADLRALSNAAGFDAEQFERATKEIINGTLVSFLPGVHEPYELYDPNTLRANGLRVASGPQGEFFGSITRADLPPYYATRIINLNEGAMQSVSRKLHSNEVLSHDSFAITTDDIESIDLRGVAELLWVDSADEHGLYPHRNLRTLNDYPIVNDEAATVWTEIIRMARDYELIEDLLYESP